MYPCLVSKNKQELLEYRLSSGDFTRTRKLPVEHVVGTLLYMSAHRNADGYAISSQNYFSEVSRYVGQDVDPATHQAFSKAREKLDWEALRFLLRQANQDRRLSGARYRYCGHVARAVDGTQLTLPRSEELLEYFEQRSSSAGLGHYPGALLVTAMNVFTGQAKAARVGNHICSEREQLRSMIELDFSPGDISLLDRGFGGDPVFLCFEDHRQHYLCRMRASGKSNARYVQEFRKSGKKDALICQTVSRKEEGGEKVEIKIRLIRGPKDSEGKRIILATNLLDGRTYTRKSLLKLYQFRWTVETHYGRVKNLLKLEAFHSRSVNGVMQEIFANLLVMSLTALVSLSAAAELKLDPEVAVPSFKNAQSVVKRHLLDAIGVRPRQMTKKKAMETAKQMIKEASRLIWKKQPGRSYPRVSQQPIKVWNLAKTKKVKEFRDANGTSCARKTRNSNGPVP